MSIPIKQGTQSTEHWHALAAEALGALTLVGGFLLVLCTPQAWPGVALAGIGAGLSGWAAASYAASRGAVKAAAVRRPADQAPRI